MQAGPTRDGGAPRVRAGARVVVPLLVTLWMLLVAVSARAAMVYHVDNTSAAASVNGPGTAAKPYLTIGAAVTALADSNVTILVHPGTYREKVIVGRGGTGPRPFVLRANGPGVVVSGADDFSDAAKWTPASGDVWLAPGVTWQPLQVFADGGRLAQSAASPLDIETGTWVYVPGTGLYMNVGGDCPSQHQAEVGRRSHAFLLQGCAHVFLEGFDAKRTEGKGIELIDAAFVIVKRNHVSQCGSGGIAAESSSDLQIFGNTVNDNNHHGILFRDGVTRSLIDDNDTFGNAHLGEAWATGIYLAGSPGNVIECNRIHENQDSGCEIQTGSNDCIVRQNLSWSNGDHGFAHLYVTGTLDLGNVAWGNRHEAFSVEGGSTGTRLYNCIALDRAVQPNTYCMLVDTSSTAGFDADYNVLWNALGGASIRFGKNVYATAGAFAAATGIGTHTLQADPRFVDAWNGDFHLLPDSPAIDDATSSIPGWSETDAAGQMRFDDPDCANMGAGPIGFADRGALEFQTGTLAVGAGPAPRALMLSGAFPNPGRGSVAFTLRLAGADDVTWGVYDVTGREVWSESGPRPAGASTLRWPATDRTGTPVASGMYLVRVHRTGETASQRFVVMH